MKKFVHLISAASLLLPLYAIAAGTEPPPPPPQQQDFSGFYVGLTGGYTEGIFKANSNSELQDPEEIPPASLFIPQQH